MSNIKEILLVDDDKNFRRDLEKELQRRLNANVTSAKNLSEVLEFVGKKKYDLYLTDGKYPLEKNKSEVRGAWKKFNKAVKKAHPEAEVVVITSDTIFTPDEAKALGILYLRKEGSHKIVDNLIEMYDIKP